MNVSLPQDSEKERACKGSDADPSDKTRQLRMIIENTSTILWAVDREGVFTLSEGRGLNALGLKPGEVVGQSVFEMYEHVPEVTNAIRDALAGRKLWSTVKVGDLWFDTVYSPVLGNNDQVEGVIGISTDVTERQRAERALSAADERFRAVFSSSPVGMLIIRRDDGYVVDANSRFLAMCGHSLDQLREQGLDLLRSTLPKEELTRWQQLATKGYPVSGVETRYSQPTGRVLIASVSVSEINTSENQCLLVTVEDVTEQKQAEQALLELNDDLEHRIAARTAELTAVNAQMQEEAVDRQQMLEALKQSEEDWRALVTNAPDLILNVDRDGKIVFINHPVPPMTHNDVLGRSVLDFVPEESTKTIEQLLEYVFATGKKTSAETGGVGPDHSQAWYSSRIGPIKRNGEVVEAMVIARDITRERQAEIELQQRRDELAHVSRLTSMGELTSAIAHEIAQPLHSMSATVGACHRWLQSSTPDLELLRTAIEDLRSESERARETIRRLWNFLKKHDVQFHAVDTNRAIRDVAKLAASEAANRGVDIQLKLSPNEPHIEGDEIQLQQVLLNLALNGMEAMQSTKRDRCRLVLESLTPTPDTVEIRVRDYGTGLPDDAVEKIFEAFYTTKSGGLGMGLAISRTIIEAHGGHLKAEQQPDGATLVVTLPLRSNHSGK